MNTYDVSQETASVDESAELGMDPNLNAILGVLGGAGDTDPMAILISSLEAQAQSNPKMAQILRCLEQRRVQQMQNSAAETATEDRTGDDEDEYERSPHLGSKVSELHDLLEQAYAEVETLQVRNDALAAALGACHLCFGEDRRCEECGGRGVPGSRRPEPAAFRKFVLPALQRIKAIQSARGVGTSPSQRQTVQNGGTQATKD